MTSSEYLLSYGSLGDFGRFYPVIPVVCRRGQQAVVRSHRGLELATVLGPASAGHAHFLPNTTVGQILRLATPEDHQTAYELRTRAQQLFADARHLAAASELPIEVVDVEVLLDGEHAVVHSLRWGDFDPRPFVSALSRKFDLHLSLEDLTPGVAAVEQPDEHEHRCDRPDCGSGGGCGTSGACSTCALKSAVDAKLSRSH
jgi:cell fate regulator YaaT (PSP1 superfamily)